jgi:hypothetical protein
MNHFKALMLSGICLLLFLGCSKDQLKPVNDDGSVPLPVTNVKVENLSGGASITYNLPAGGKALYVLAEWEQQGKVMTAQASYYNTSVLVEGLGDTQPRDIQLYAVGRNLKRSEPVTVQINPLTPPGLSILESLDINEDFGGLRIDFTNVNEAPVSIEVFYVNDLGVWVSKDVFYTERLSGRLFVRGFDAEERMFGFTVKDKWGNITERLTRTLTPLFEREFDKSLFSTLSPTLPGDMGVYPGSALSNLWSGNYTGGDIESNGFFRSANSVTLPAHFTFDMGVVGKLGRYVMRQRGAYNPPGTFIYSGGGPRRWEVWGRADRPTSGGWDGWIKLMDCEIIKPSGLPVDTRDQSDIEAAQAGHEFSFSPDLPLVRYIRINVLSNWGGVQYVNLAELSFFGNPGQ